MNFGKWIVVSFILFAIFIGTLVTVCVRQDISLVSQEYYKDELAYQDQITRIENAKSLKVKPTITKVSDKLEISFGDKVDRGELRLFCPSDPKMDRVVPLDLSDNKQIVDVASLKRGMYRVKLYWSAGVKEFFVEEIIYI